MEVFPWARIGMSRLGWMLMVAWTCVPRPTPAAAPADPARFRIATYNVENYLLDPVGTRPAKSTEARQAVRRMIHRAEADILALQEIGGTGALEELRESLHREGLWYPHAVLAWGHDTNIAVAVLSRFPITANRSLTNASFLLLGRRHFVNRAFLEVDLQVSPGYALTLVAAHLKSRRTSVEADEAELREQEALLLRARVEARLARDPGMNLVVLGDLNDTRDSRPVRTLLGRPGPRALLDARPCECDDVPPRTPSARTTTWTHFYAKEDTYSRIDYVLLSRGMVPGWVREASCVVRAPEWGEASDHRPVVATFTARPRRQSPRSSRPRSPGVGGAPGHHAGEGVSGGRQRWG